MNSFSKHLYIAFAAIILCLFVQANLTFASTTSIYAYDDLNRLTKVMNSDRTVIDYTYDEIGNRGTKTVSVGPILDTTAPIVSGFTIPVTATSVKVPVSLFTATDNVAVTGYVITETAIAPDAGVGGWSSTAPTFYITAAAGEHTLYAYAKDAAGNVSVGVSATVSIPPKSDFNGDGLIDILWRNSATGDDLVWFMNGTTMTGYAYLTNVADPNWKIVGTGDFNGDRQTDILWRHSVTGDNLVWFMNGTTMTGSAYLTNVADPNWKIVGTGDFNGDGQTDILWRHSVTGDNLVWFMNGTTISGSAYLTNVADPNWKIVGTGDFNGDGQTDILWRHSVTGDNLVWFMNGTTMPGSAYLTNVADPNWNIAGTGDFNGDGQTDILWRHSVTGDNVVWFMNGTTMAGYAYLTNVAAATNWSIVGR